MDGVEFRAKREMCGLTQQHIADSACVSVRTVKRWEGGKTHIPADVEHLIEEAFTMHRAAVDSQVAEVRKAMRYGCKEVVVRYRAPRRVEAGTMYQFDNAVARAIAEQTLALGMRVHFTIDNEKGDGNERYNDIQIGER